ncbi:mitotic interactor and substrate of PLK1 [Denticeps clupeoides]|uniref:Uncharacterized protein n=1 Tax=Denticeps clupeoides TaxID=299321 RepID=A0AAY4A3R2_9TELE|nr:uncharacterized protein MISP3 [Denticeps clupeoides]XP_028828887.1 uncharacterized protein MISP3 [Denticeps clupeoides]
MEAEYYDDNQSDSGVSADFSPNSTGDIPNGTLTPEPEEPSHPPPNETPIEREIRRAAEREQSLRRSRGLNKAMEFVEIPLRKPVLSEVLGSKPTKNEGVDRQFAGKKMQKEIHLELQREQVLVELGRVPGVYEKGTVRQLHERKLLFEVFQIPKEPGLISPSQGKRSFSASTSDLSTLSPLDDMSLSSSCNVSFVDQTQSPTPQDQGFTGSPLISHRPEFPESTNSQVIVVEVPPPPPHSIAPASRQDWETIPVTVLDAGSVPVTVVDFGANGCSTPPDGRDDQLNEAMEAQGITQGNPFFKLRSSISMLPNVEQDIREAQEREMELRKLRTSLYGVMDTSRREGGGGWRTPSREIRTPVPPPNGLPALCQHSRSPSSASDRPSGKLDLTWPPPLADSAPKGPKEAPNPRHKNGLLQRWEAGMLNGHSEGED